MLTTGQSTKPSLPCWVLAVVSQQPLLLPIFHTVFHSSLSTGCSGSLWMAWSCWWARVSTKAVPCSSDIHGTNCTAAGSPSTHAVPWRDAPAFWGNKGAAGPALLQRHCSQAALLKKHTIFYSNHMSSQNPHWLLISQIYSVPLWAFC